MRLSILGLSIFLSLHASAGEFRLSPTLHLHGHKATVDSHQTDLLRDDLVYGVEGSLEAAYKEQTYQIEGTVWNEMYRYTNFDENSNNLNYELKFDTLFPRNDVRVYGVHRRTHEVMNTIRSSFKDKMFAYDTPILIERNRFGAQYDTRPNAIVDGFVSWKYSGDDTIGAGIKDTYFYDQNTYHASLGNYKSLNRVFWRIDGEYNFYRRIDDRKYNIHQNQGEVKLAVDSNMNYFLVGRIADSLYENPAIKDDSVLGYARQRAWYTGIALQSDTRRTYAELTKGRERDKEYAFWSGQFRYTEGNGHQLNLSYDKNFYGDAPNLSWVYETDRFRSQISYKKDVDLSYMVTAQSYLSALYACPKEVTELDPEECRMLSGAQDQLSSNERLFPQYLLRYPIGERLIIEENTSFNLADRHNTWNQQFFILASRSEDIEYKNIQKAIESHWNIIKNEGQPNQYQAEFRFRKTELQPLSVFSYDRLYQVTYQRNLNSHAFFQIYARVLDKDTSDNGYEFVDKRVGIQYVHYFGDKHPEKLAFSYPYEEFKDNHQLSRSRFDYQ